jgi:hypothetical protein
MMHESKGVASKAWRVTFAACFAAACGGQSERSDRIAPSDQRADAAPRAPDGSSDAAASGGASGEDAGVSDGVVVHDAGPSWRDPESPPTFPGQHTSSTPCPTLEPRDTEGCTEPGKECAYPVCWGAGNKTWVCVENRWRLWFDESFKCTAGRPCPAVLPLRGSTCTTGPFCYYPIDCCGRVAGFTAAECLQTQWQHRVTFRPDECPLCTPFPTQDQACSLEDACKSGPPALCYRPTCYGGNDVARCDGARWQIEIGCSK